MEKEEEQNDQRGEQVISKDGFNFGSQIVAYIGIIQMAPHFQSVLFSFGNGLNISISH